MTRSPRGMTRDPCHCCGGTELRYTNRICAECQRTFEFATKRAAELALLADQAPVPFHTKERDYALPYLHHGGDPGRELQTAFFDLSVLVSEPTEKRPPMLPPDRYHDYSHSDPQFNLWPPEKGMRYSGDWAAVRAFVPSVGIAIRRAYAAAMTALDFAYRDGHDDGRRLLLSLAAGEITADEFNDRAARVDA